MTCAPWRKLLAQSLTCQQSRLQTHSNLPAAGQGSAARRLRDLRTAAMAPLRTHSHHAGAWAVIQVQMPIYLLPSIPVYTAPTDGRHSHAVRHFHTSKAQRLSGFSLNQALPLVKGNSPYSYLVHCLLDSLPSQDTDDTVDAFILIIVQHTAYTSIN